MTLVLRHSEVARSLDALTLLATLKDAFRVRGESVVLPPVQTPGVTLALGVGFLPDVPAYSLRVDTQVSTPGSAPTRTLHLHDRTSGALLAVMDAQHLCAIRTGVMGALAAELLARTESPRVALIGAGPQSAVQLKCLRLVRMLQHVRLFDVNPVRAMQLAGRLYRELQLPVRVEDSAEAAVADADIVIVATDSETPFLMPGMLRAGTQVTSLGPHDVADAVLAQARVVTDSGPELGEILAGRKEGRSSDSELTLFQHRGAPFTELLAAWQVYEAMRDDPEAVRVELERKV